MVAFDKALIKYVYEPEGFDLAEYGYYLPDFYLPQVDMYAEVKGKHFTIEELEKAQALAIQSGKTVLLLAGQPSRKSYWAVTPTKREGWDCQIEDKIFFAMDYEIYKSQYWLSEGRFFENSGCGADSFPHPHSPGYEDDDACEPVWAARSARFEHGECGQTIPSRKFLGD
jgi:hypothetical protein